MTKIWLIMVGLGVFLIISLLGSGKGAAKVNPDLIYGRWSSFDGTIWYEFYHNGMATSQYDEEEYVGSFRELPEGDFEVLKTKRGEREMVFIREGRLVIFRDRVEFRLRKEKDFVPGLVQR